MGCSWSLRMAEVRTSGPLDPVHRIQTYLSARGNLTPELGHWSQLLFLSHSAFSLAANPIGCTSRRSPEGDLLPGPHRCCLSSGNCIRPHPEFLLWSVCHHGPSATEQLEWLCENTRWILPVLCSEPSVASIALRVNARRPDTADGALADASPR